MLENYCCEKILAAAGLHRTPKFKLWMMVEILQMFILLVNPLSKPEFDGVSIGSN